MELISLVDAPRSRASPGRREDFMCAVAGVRTRGAVGDAADASWGWRERRSRRCSRGVWGEAAFAWLWARIAEEDCQGNTLSMRALREARG